MTATSGLPSDLPPVGVASAAASTKDIGAEYPTPAPSGFTTFDALKARIREHYELCSDYYLSLWGEHIHHGYFLRAEDSKEAAQLQLIQLLLERSGLSEGSRVLDVGCGVGGTTRYLAREHGCVATGITISGAQVRMAKELTSKEEGGEQQHQGRGAAGKEENEAEGGFFKVGRRGGRVRFIELDAEKMGGFEFCHPNPTNIAAPSFDAVWISEAMSHLPDKKLFFHNAFAQLGKGGKLIVADWFKAEGLSPKEIEGDIRPIEDGMLLPPLCTQSDYVEFATQAGFTVFSEPLDISKQVAKTWDISFSLVQSPSLWALALTQGRDFIAFLQAFRAMRRGYANGTFRYAVLVFEQV